MQIKKLTIQNISKHINEIMHIAIPAFTRGIYEQHIDEKETKDWFKSLFNQGGYGFAAFEENMIGFIIGAPTSYDQLMPKYKIADYDIDKCWSIASLAVGEDARGKGIGSKLVKGFLDSLKDCDHVFVRTIAGNEFAINTYEKFGFKKCWTADIEKVKKDRSGKFMETKQYLAKHLNE